jgi:hypothetical protein
MTTLFFIFGVLVILYEFNTFLDPRKGYKTLKNIEENKEFFTDENVPKDLRNQGCIFAFFHIGYAIWGILGLVMASQWVLFSWIFAIGISASILGKIFKKLRIDGSSLHMSIRRIDGIACSLIALEIVLVHFHEFSIFNYLVALL